MKDSEIKEKLTKIFSSDPEHLLDQEINELSSSIEKKIPDISKKLELMKTSLEKEFPLDTKPFERGIIISAIWSFLEVPLTLYALNMNSLVVIELHGTLERLFMGSTVRLLSIPSRKEHVMKLLERKTLLDLTQTLFDLEILDNDDLKFLKKLNKFRNGIAHKNLEIISKIVQEGEDLSFNDIIDVVNSVDVTSDIINSVKIIIKLVRIVESKIITESLQEMFKDGTVPKEVLEILSKEIDQQFGKLPDKS